VPLWPVLAKSMTSIPRLRRRASRGGMRIASTIGGLPILCCRGAVLPPQSGQTDRKSILVVPAVIRISRFDRILPASGREGARLGGSIQEVASAIHIPRPSSEDFSGLSEKARYRVHVRYGKLFEVPWTESSLSGNSATPAREFLSLQRSRPENPRRQRATR
jgi:hypothetical protein